MNKFKNLKILRYPINNKINNKINKINNNKINNNKINNYKTNWIIIHNNLWWCQKNIYNYKHYIIHKHNNYYKQKNKSNNFLFNFYKNKIK